MSISCKLSGVDHKLSRLPSLGEMGRIYFKYNILLPFSRRPLLPHKLVFYVTSRCNAKCVMCNLWATDVSGAIKRELSLKELERVFSNALFGKIEHVDINGGEPTLRNDLLAIIEMVIKQFPRLKHLSMSSNGLLSEQVVSLARNIVSLCRMNNVKFSLALSIHGVGNVLEKVSRVKEAFRKIEETIAGLKAVQKNSGNFLSVNCVFTNVNLLEVGKLVQWSKRERLPVRFALGEVRERFLNLQTRSKTLIGEDKKDFLIRFLRELSGNKDLFNPSAFRYHHLANMIERNEPRTMACHYALGGVILGPYGELYYCPHSKEIGNCRDNSAYEIYYRRSNLEYRKNELMARECRRCPPYSFDTVELQKNAWAYLKFLLFGG